MRSLVLYTPYILRYHNMAVKQYCFCFAMIFVSTLEGKKRHVSGAGGFGLEGGVFCFVVIMVVD